MQCIDFDKKKKFLMQGMDIGEQSCIDNFFLSSKSQMQFQNSSYQSNERDG